MLALGQGILTSKEGLAGGKINLKQGQDLKLVTDYDFKAKGTIWPQTSKLLLLQIYEKCMNAVACYSTLY